MLEPSTNRDTHHEHLITIYEVNIQPWRNFPPACLECIIATDTHEEIGTQIPVFDTGCDEKFPTPRMVGKRHRVHPEIEITKRVLSQNTDTKRLGEPPFVFNAQCEAFVTPIFTRHANINSHQVPLIFMLGAVFI